MGDWLNLAERVLNERKRLGWKQFALACEAGVTERTIQRLESGSRVNQETVRKVMRALGIREQSAGRRRRKRGSRDREFCAAVIDAASGLYGESLGFGIFMRRLPDAVLERAGFALPVLILVACHAMLIVNGNPEAGIPMDRLDDETLHRMRTCLIFEHLRRRALIRVRYPRDPFEEVPEIAWWTGNPMGKVLCELPAEIRDRCIEVIIQTGDLSVLGGYVIAQPDADMEEFVRQSLAIQNHLPELLQWIEEQFHDSDKEAWTEPIEGKPME
jgi:transcriptional regulator with XRE-family HTH domain